MRTNMRDAAITSLMEGSNIDFQSYKTVSSFINNQYWGLYNLREKVSENMLASKHEVNPNDIDMLGITTEGLTVIDGDGEEYMQLRQYIEQNDLSNSENYNYVINQIDIDNYMEYHIAQIYMDNRDYPGNNVKFWKHPEGKWRWIYMIQILDSQGSGGLNGIRIMRISSTPWILFCQVIKLHGRILHGQHYL